jgi:hypothetical protein
VAAAVAAAGFHELPNAFQLCSTFAAASLTALITLGANGNTNLKKISKLYPSGGALGFALAL